MSFFSRIFGAGHPLDEIRKASNQGRWADVLTGSSILEEKPLVACDLEELRRLADAASEELSHINYEESLASFRADDFRRGMEHLILARQLARSSELQKLIDVEFALVESKMEVGDVVKGAPPITGKSCSSSCCGTPTVNAKSMSEHTGVFDEETRFDLVLTAYPVDLRPRYLNLSPLMRRAILLAHEEKGDEALTLFFSVPEDERTDIFYYELGSIFARNNRYSDAVKALQQAISLNSGFIYAALTLVDLHIANKDFAMAENLLEQMLRAKCMPDYCHARFSLISQAQGNMDKAFDHATEALSLGYIELELMVFVARTLESRGRIEEAEGVLSSLPVGGGCSGAANVELADFWLRHKKNLQKSLEMFKNAAKSDPANPLWGYNIARVYLALGWRKDARQVLEAFVHAETIDGSLRENAIQLLRESA